MSGSINQRRESQNISTTQAQFEKGAVEQGQTGWPQTATFLVGSMVDPNAAAGKRAAARSSVAQRISRVAAGSIRDDFAAKTRPVLFEITARTSRSIADWIEALSSSSCSCGDGCFPNVDRPSPR